MPTGVTTQWVGLTRLNRLLNGSKTQLEHDSFIERVTRQESFNPSVKRVKRVKRVKHVIQHDNQFMTRTTGL